MSVESAAVNKLMDCYARQEQAEPSFAPAFLAAPAEGLLLEFGVASGGSFFRLCQLAAPRTVYGFDWFYGLPEDWNSYNPRGKFSTYGALPRTLPNGEIIVGMVQNTLGEFLRSHDGPIAFAHMDLDLYSSSSFVLKAIAPRCTDGTILLFDEIVGNPQDEEKAFLEFIEYTGFDFEFVTRRNRDAIAFRLGEHPAGHAGQG
jgi:hypothetical protein